MGSEDYEEELEPRFEIRSSIQDSLVKVLLPCFLLCTSVLSVCGRHWLIYRETNFEEI
jgi:hypothetical protein